MTELLGHGIRRNARRGTGKLFTKQVNEAGEVTDCNFDNDFECK